MVQDAAIPLEEALLCMSRNVAEALGLYPQKGVLQVDSDADLVLLDEQLEIASVMAKGVWMMKEYTLLKRGMFE